MTSVTGEGAVPHASGDVAAVARVQSVSQRLVDCLGVQQDGVVERSHETVHLLATQFNNRTACSLYASQVSVQLRTTWHCPRLLLRARRAAIDRHTRRAHSSKSAVPYPAVLFCSLAVLDPKAGHTMDVLSPFIRNRRSLSVRCYSGRMGQTDGHRTVPYTRVECTVLLNGV